MDYEKLAQQRRVTNYDRTREYAVIELLISIDDQRQYTGLRTYMNDVVEIASNYVEYKQEIPLLIRMRYWTKNVRIAECMGTILRLLALDPHTSGAVTVSWWNTHGTNTLGYWVNVCIEGASLNSLVIGV